MKKITTWFNNLTKKDWHDFYTTLWFVFGLICLINASNTKDFVQIKYTVYASLSIIIYFYLTYWGINKYQSVKYWVRVCNKNSQETYYHFDITLEYNEDVQQGIKNYILKYPVWFKNKFSEEKDIIILGISKL